MQSISIKTFISDNIRQPQNIENEIEYSKWFTNVKFCSDNNLKYIFRFYEQKEDSKHFYVSIYYLCTKLVMHYNISFYRLVIILSSYCNKY